VGNVTGDEEKSACCEIGSVVFESDGESEPVPLGSCGMGILRVWGGIREGESVERGEMTCRDL